MPYKQEPADPNHIAKAESNNEFSETVHGCYQGPRGDSDQFRWAPKNDLGCFPAK